MKLISFKAGMRIVFINPGKVNSLEESDRGGTIIQLYNHQIFVDDSIKKVQRRLLYIKKKTNETK